MRIGFVCQRLRDRGGGLHHDPPRHVGARDGARGLADRRRRLRARPDETVRGWARAAPRKSYRSTKTFLAEVQGDEARVERIDVDDLDVLMLRNDPAADLDAAVGAERGLHLRPARRRTTA